MKKRNRREFIVDSVKMTGAAICAAAGVGIYASIDDAAGHMVQIKKEYFPRADHRHLYDRLFHEVYCKFYDRVHDVVHTASGIIK